MRGKFETEIAELTRELDTMRDKWSKSRDEAAKREEELIVVKALLKTKEVALYGAQEVSQILCILQHFLLLFHSVCKSLKKSHFTILRATFIRAELSSGRSPERSEVSLKFFEFKTVA